jgi:DNA-binding transcriptional MerR regulator
MQFPFAGSFNRSLHPLVSALQRLPDGRRAASFTNSLHLKMTARLSSITVMKKPSTFTLDEIASLAELPRRTVRYYIQSGLIGRPKGVGKGAYYTEHHIEQLLMVRKWQLAGLSLERIGELLKQQAAGPLPPTPRRAGTVEVWSPLVVADGIELTLEPGRAGLTPEQVRTFFRAVAEAYEQLNESKGQE